MMILILRDKLSWFERNDIKGKRTREIWWFAGFSMKMEREYGGFLGLVW